MSKKKTNRLFKAAKDYNKRTVVYNDDYSAFKTRRTILIEIYKYGPHEKLKQKKLMEKINKYSNLISEKSKRSPASWVVLGSQAERALREALEDVYNRNEEDEMTEEE